MYKVMIVEDDPMVARINEEYIRLDSRFELVVKCADGESALRYLEDNTADLMILDIYMPHLDGLKLLHCVREREMHVDIIMVTAANDRAAVEEALHAGVVDYLVKPFTMNRFQLALEKFILQRSTLSSEDSFSQKHIDFLLDSAAQKLKVELPKGIQADTLHFLQARFRESGSTWQTCEEIAARSGISIVTARRYMGYLVDLGEAESRMNYETGGRPCMQYRNRK